MTPTERETETMRDLATALAYRFSSAGFRYPDATGCRGLHELGCGLPRAIELFAESSPLADLLDDVLGPLESSAVDELEDAYVSLFGHTVHGPCPLYETEYGGDNERLQQPHEMADLNVFYRGFGLELGERVSERPDYLPLELEFAAFLCLKHAHALDHDDAELARLTLDARRRFLSEHLGRWTPTFGALLLKEAGPGFYRGLTRFVLALIKGDCTSLGISRKSANLSLRAPAEAPDAFTQCAMSAERPAFDV